MQANTIICLMGPTASGKTQLAIELTQQLPLEIISVDSAMVYRGMDIGTAKPDASILEKIPHHLINICDPTESYSVAQFRVDALREIAAIFAKGKIPLLVGGTMMYFNVLQHGLSELPSANPAIRANLAEILAQQGLQVLHERLTKIDPQAALRIHPNDTQRILRALEVYELSGVTLSEFHQQNLTSILPYDVCNVAITPDRALLHERIAERFSHMLSIGFVDEVQALFHRGDLNLELPSMRSVGYRQVWEYLLGNYSFAEMHERGIIATRQLAKRQLTWLRNWNTNLYWFDSETKGLTQNLIEFFKSVIKPVP